MAPYRRWLDPLLRYAILEAEHSKDTVKELHARLALLPVDPSHVDPYLFSQLLDAYHDEVPIILKALAPYKGALLDRLWAVAESPPKGWESRRLRAVSALAEYDPETRRWANVQEAIANDLVSVPAVHLGWWMAAPRPVRSFLLAPLSDIFRDRTSERAPERMLATELLVNYTDDNPQVRADLLMDADDKQFREIFPHLRGQGELSFSMLIGEIDEKLPTDMPASDEKREKVAKRQANAAVALLRLNQPEKVWPLLKHTADPRVRSYLIHRLSPLGADAGVIVKRLDEESDLTIRRALILSLGEYGEKGLDSDARNSWLPKVQVIYRTDADPGLHAASEWLLRTWKKEAWIMQVNAEWANDQTQRDKRVRSIQHVVEQGQRQSTAAMVRERSGADDGGDPRAGCVHDGVAGFGADRGSIEPQHEKRIDRTFAIAAKPVTVEQYEHFEKGYANQLSRPVHGDG